MVKRWLRVLYTSYGVVIFSTLFFIFLPLLFIPIIFPKQFRLIGILNRWWAKLLFAGIFLPFKAEYRDKLDRNTCYVFAPNHFSYMDIPTLGLNYINTIFVGKSGIGSIPIFGYMYSKLHITVDRTKLKSRYTSMKRSMDAIDEGKSLVIYPEGGIMTKKDPVMGNFKDGAFRVAIEKQIPLVPVTIPFNWIILPPEEFLLCWHPLRVIFHEPIDTKGLTLRDMDALKKQVFVIIHNELQKHLNNEDRSPLA